MRFPWSSTARRRPSKPLVQVPFIGQEALLERLTAQLHAASTGAIQYATLAGPAGCGTSTLVEEWRFLHNKPGVLFLHLNAAECLLPYEWYRHLWQGLQAQSTQIVHTLYQATQRVRKNLSLQWEEQEFRQVLASTDWAQVQEAPAQVRTGRGTGTNPLAPLFLSVQDHPWAIGAATLLGSRERRVDLEGSAQRLWEQRWSAGLHTLQGRYQAGQATLVVVIDHLTSGALSETAVDTARATAWQTFVTLTTAAALPCMLLWTGTAATLQPIQQVLRDMSPATTYQAYTLERLEGEAQQQLVRRAVRVLPRALQAPWETVLASAGEQAANPTWLLLATTCAVVASERSAAAGLPDLGSADIPSLVQRLVDDIRQRHPTQAALYSQVLDILAFMPPGKQAVVDDFLPLCDFAALGLEPVAGRAALELLLGQCVRAGLLRHDPYAGRYTLGSSAIQDALQSVLYPDPMARWQVARQRRLAAALLGQIQHGERTGLAALAAYIEDTHGAAARTLAAPFVVEPFRRLLPMCTREERQRMAVALGGLPSALAVDLLRFLVHDEEGQVRSSAVQALADLGRDEGVPVLLDAIRDRNSDVRWIATRALGQMPGSTAVDALIPMLTDEDKEVGRIAAESLGQQGDRRAVPHLMAALQESYPRLRESAIQALATLADPRAIPALQAVLQDAHPYVRRSAEAALARFDTPAGH